MDTLKGKILKTDVQKRTWYGWPKHKRPKSKKAETIGQKNSKGRKIRPNVKKLKVKFS